MPTLVLSGSKDNNAPAPMMAKMASYIPAATYIEIEGVGHLVNLERPAAFNAALDRALAGMDLPADAIAVANGPARVMTLADEHASDLGVRLSAPTPNRAPEAVDQTMPLLASGELRLRSQQCLPMSSAAEAHRLLETGEAHQKLLLTTDAELAEVAT